VPRVRPLSRLEAQRSLANRLGSRIDRVRQIATRLGIRPYRVFLVWDKYSGDERGEGVDREAVRREILPTPRVVGLDSISITPFTGGMMQDGSITLELVSVSYTLEQLTGLAIPDPNEDHIPQPYAFFYEVYEDGRGESQPLRSKFRLAAVPQRFPGRVQWNVRLERISVDNARDGSSQYGDGGLCKQTSTLASMRSSSTLSSRVAIWLRAKGCSRPL